MALVFIIVLVLAACYAPGFAQSNSPYLATALANANAVSIGGSASASSYSYAYYPTYENEGVYDCTYNRCTPTCSIPFPRNCPANSNPCNCPRGTIISDKGGYCVRNEQCQRFANCNGDYNARFTDCPNPCRSTCAQPDGGYCYSNRCGAPGCECNSGYILSDINGKCIRPEQCPGGYVCGKNQTFLNCLAECPNLYCPVSVARVACGPTQPPCRGGCGCKYNYLRKNIYDHTCILASDCPPGKCYGPHEEWNRCVSLCFSDACQDRNKVPVPGDCPFSPSECYPQCLCKKGFYRNSTRFPSACIPEQECPP